MATEKAKDVDDLKARLDSFLATRREAKDGGWAPVEAGDLDELYGLFEDVVNLKWEGDDEGGRPIQFKLVDLTTHERFHHEPVRRSDGFKPEEHIARLRFLTMNLLIATDAIRRYTDGYERHRLRDLEAGGKPRKEAT